MKKHFALLTLFIGFAGSHEDAQCGPQRRTSLLHTNRPAILQRVLERQAGHDPDVPAKPTALVQRMVAEVVYQQGNIASDSFRYSYASP